MIVFVGRPIKEIFSMDVRQEIAEVIGKISKHSASVIRDDMHLVADLGIDSVKAMELLIELEDRLQIEIDDDAATNLETVADVISTATRLVRC